MTYPEALRAYADWLEQNPDLGIAKGSISHYSSDGKISDLVRHGATITPLPGNEIAYAHLPQFAPLCITFVMRKETIMTPAIRNGLVVWTLKPEFAGSVVS